ncbi:hypothetical protein [Rhodococcus qingshengii]|uniref:hypothetical protein n=1 Tax=Rhodococcus qingshengii TaxID=334542 RepID=UPI0027A7994D|nr:hypothetical protein PI247_30435 [Rhodococcus qingshengii]
MRLADDVESTGMYFLMNAISRPVGDTWAFYSPFPPQVTSGLIEVLVDQLAKVGIRF